MPRVLLLCFIHGFKGNEDTFHDFPYDLKRQVARDLPDHRVESIVYPKYETKGELAEASAAFLEWLKERVIGVRKKDLENPWPPNDREVGVILIAHSMGGFVAADTLFLAINEREEKRAESGEENHPIFPLIQGILTFDTPYNGLARSMFVYGAFSNYSKVSNVFNVMTALGAAAPASLGRLSAQRAAISSASTAAVPRSSPAWKTWQLVAVRTGTVGAIAAGGVAAYMHREAIMQGVQNMRNLNRDSIAEGYKQSVETLGQGLAYVNRGSVGESFAWLSDHFTFVGALMKPKELNRRLERLAALRGVGVRDFYVSLGENGYWNGGYFVPERTFCAVPEEGWGDEKEKDKKTTKPSEDEKSSEGKQEEKQVEKPVEKLQASELFERCVIREAEDEIQAHMSMFRPARNRRYEGMTEDAASLIRHWFLSEEDVFDDPKFREKAPEEAAEDTKVEETLNKSQEEIEKTVDEELPEAEKATAGDDGLPDESPIDIAAAASLVPLPGDQNGDLVGNAEGHADAEQQRRTYRQYLFQVAQQTGTGARAWWPTKMPNVPSMPSVSLPAMPNLPSSVSSLGQVSMPSVNFFGKKQAAAGDAGDATQVAADTSAAEVGEKAKENAQTSVEGGEKTAEDKAQTPATGEAQAQTETPGGGEAQPAQDKAPEANAATEAADTAAKPEAEAPKDLPVEAEKTGTEPETKA